MKKQFLVENINGITRVELLYKYTGNNEYKTKVMYQVGEFWKTELEIKDNPVIYKYVLNDFIRLNDCFANEYIKEDNDEVFSVYNSEDDIAYMEEGVNLLPIHIKNNVMQRSNKIYEQIGSISISNYLKRYNVTEAGVATKNIIKAADKNVFILGKDKLIALYIDINNFKGIHSVTVFWHQPDGKIYRIEERAIGDKNNKEMNAQVCFFIEMNWDKGFFYKNTWSYSVLIDGKMVRREYFVVKDSVKQSVDGYNSYFNAYS